MIATRWPVLAILSTLGAAQLSIVILLHNVLKDNYNDVNSTWSVIVLWSSHMLLPLHFVPYLLRVIRLHFMFRSSHPFNQGDEREQCGGGEEAEEHIRALYRGDRSHKYIT